ncbi:MAG: tripartite tricarboxylate transporter TctB family protein [Alphaproteobacteria bacterium]
MAFSDAALGLIVLLAGAAVVWTASGFPEMAGMAYGPAFFPTLIGIGFCLCGLSLLLSAWLSHQRAGVRLPWLTPADWFGDRMAVARVLGVVVAVIVYALLCGWLGFLLTMALITGALLLLMGAPKPISAVLAIALPLALHYGFSVMLRVPLPRGPIERLLF